MQAAPALSCCRHQLPGCDSPGRMWNSPSSWHVTSVSSMRPPTLPQSARTPNICACRICVMAAQSETQNVGRRSVTGSEKFSRTHKSKMLSDLGACICAHSERHGVWLGLRRPPGGDAAVQLRPLQHTLLVHMCEDVRRHSGYCHLQQTSIKEHRTAGRIRAFYFPACCSVPCMMTALKPKNDLAVRIVSPRKVIVAHQGAVIQECLLIQMPLPQPGCCRQAAPTSRSRSFEVKFGFVWLQQGTGRMTAAVLGISNLQHIN